MNLAIHDFRGLADLHERGLTRGWSGRGIRPWTTLEQLRGRREYDVLVEEVPLELLELWPEEVAFCDVFRERFRRLTRREQTLLFLAAVTSSVVLTEEFIMAKTARSLGLGVCKGDAAALEVLFPMQAEPPRETALPPVASRPLQSPPLPVESIVQGLREEIFCHQFPSSRRVPEWDEPVDPSPVVVPRGRRDQTPPVRETQCNQNN